MCGIHFILDKRQQLLSSAPLDRMMQESAYRGPDAAGTLRIDQRNHTAWLGSQRLKISDPHERADQPFVSSDGRYHLLYNGEIYNYYELRNQLLSEDVQFTTQSDTEVLLHWLIGRGSLGLNALNGMFALLLYDRQEATLWAARDRHGMKPLYYAEDEQYLLLSSEAKSIMASGLVEKVVREASFDSYLRFRYPPKGSTFFQSVAQLPEGHIFKAIGEQQSTVQSYLPTYHVAEDRPWQPGQSEESLVATLEQRLTEAVLRHRATDVPTGLFLSGGVDSTLLLALLQQEGVPPLPTFSVVHEAQDRSFGTRDAEFARRAAEQYGTYHEAVTVTAAALEEHFDAFIRHIDQPVGDSGAFMTYLLSATAAQHVKVVLSGAGADELFGGYNRHWAYYRYLHRYPLIINVLPVAKAVASWLPTGVAHPLRKPFRLLKKGAEDLTDDPTETFAHFISLAALRSTNSFPPDPAGGSPPPAELGPMGPGHDHLHRAERHLYQSEDFVEEYLSYALEHDQQHYLRSDVLTISDSMSMVHGLEMRMPYLDQEVVSFANSLPAVLRLQHGRKWLLRRLLDSKGGKAYTQRRKEGFGLPLGGWLRDGKMPLIRRYLEAPDAVLYRYVPHEQIMALLQQHRRGTHDYSQELWSVLTLSAWLAYHFPGS